MTTMGSSRDVVVEQLRPKEAGIGMRGAFRRRNDKGHCGPASRIPVPVEVHAATDSPWTAEWWLMRDLDG